MNVKLILSNLSAAVAAAGLVFAQLPQASSAPKGAVREVSQSPAARPRPKQATSEVYPTAQVQAGQQRFGSQCGFCHGRDGAGGESGPDLTRSELMAEDVHGDKLGPLLRAGRPDAGMPAFTLTDADAAAMAAFIHSQAQHFATLGGGRGSVQPEDLATGNVADGRAYFNGAGGCSGCHSVKQDLAGLATRYQGLALLQRMLYPSGRPAPAPAKATITLPSGETITAPLAAEDEFSVTVLDAQGERKSYAKDRVKLTIDDPMSAHFVQLAKYTDAAMHNVYAYLQTLK